LRITRNWKTYDNTVKKWVEVENLTILIKPIEIKTTEKEMEESYESDSQSTIMTDSSVSEDEYFEIERLEIEMGILKKRKDNEEAANVPFLPKNEKNLNEKRNSGSFQEMMNQVRLQGKSRSPSNEFGNVQDLKKTVVVFPIEKSRNWPSRNEVEMKQTAISSDLISESKAFESIEMTALKNESFQSVMIENMRKSMMSLSENMADKLNMMDEDEDFGYYIELEVRDSLRRNATLDRNSLRRQMSVSQRESVSRQKTWDRKNNPIKGEIGIFDRAQTKLKKTLTMTMTMDKEVDDVEFDRLMRLYEKNPHDLVKKGRRNVILTKTPINLKTEKKVSLKKKKIDNKWARDPGKTFQVLWFGHSKILEDFDPDDNSWSFCGNRNTLEHALNSVDFGFDGFLEQQVDVEDVACRIFDVIWSFIHCSFHHYSKSLVTKAVGRYRKRMRKQREKARRESELHEISPDMSVDVVKDTDTNPREVLIQGLSRALYNSPRNQKYRKLITQKKALMRARVAVSNYENPDDVMSDEDFSCSSLPSSSVADASMFSSISHRSFSRVQSFRELFIANSRKSVLMHQRNLSSRENVFQGRSLIEASSAPSKNKRATLTQELKRKGSARTRGYSTDFYKKFSKSTRR